MQPSSRVFNLHPAHSPPRQRTREDPRPGTAVPEIGTYGQLVGVSLEVRRARFANLVNRALEEAQRRGMTIPDIEKATNVSKTTFYRWRDGDWSRDPRGTEVRGFFEGLNASVAAAHIALDWASPETGSAEPEPPLDPVIRELIRQLRDDNTPESEKAFLWESLRMLAGRGGGRGAGQRRAS